MIPKGPSESPFSASESTRKHNFEMKRERKPNLRCEIKSQERTGLRTKASKLPSSDSKCEVVRNSKSKSEKVDLSKSPFPEYTRPTYDECITARRFLSNLHWGSPDAEMKKESTVLETENPGSPGFTVLDSLIATILSQNTTDTNSWPAFQRLKARFPTWDSARLAPVDQMEECIRSAGLARTKSHRIHKILDALAAERPGEPLSLEHLRSEQDTAAAMAQLTRFSGVGPKTAACVAMFTLGRPEFPVDTHVLRLALALGWVPRGTGREAAYAHLNCRVPNSIKLDLHVLLVLHGKVYRNDPSMLRRALAGITSANEGGAGNPSNGEPSHRGGAKRPSIDMSSDGAVAFQDCSGCEGADPKVEGRSDYNKKGKRRREEVGGTAVKQEESVFAVKSEIV